MRNNQNKPRQPKRHNKTNTHRNSIKKNTQNKIQKEKMKDTDKTIKIIHELGKKNTIPVLRTIYSRKLYYQKILIKMPNMSNKTLSDTLKPLVKMGIIKKEVRTNERPTKCFYSLTNFGKRCLIFVRMLEGEIK